MSNPAPGELELVRTFVNTWDAEDHIDGVDSPAALGGWLIERGLLEPGDVVKPAEHRRAIALREALRATLRAHHDPDEPVPGEADVMAEVSRLAKLQVGFDERGTARLTPTAAGVAGALGRLLTIAVAADAEGTWTRLKICPADDCQVAFYDRSRNHSATWCSMAVCGNRAKVREYRERRLTGFAPMKR